MAENEIETLIRATQAISIEPKAATVLAGNPKGTDSTVTSSSLGPLRGGIYQFSTVTNGSESEDLSWDSLSSDESEISDGDEDDESYTDEVDHNLLACVLPSSDNVVSDGGFYSRPKESKTPKDISPPETRPQSNASIKMNLHPNGKINEIINETISTERTLMSRLLQLKSLKGLIENVNSRHHFINESNVDAMFPDLGPVLDLHREHLLPSLEKEALRAESTSTPALIGDIFKQHVRFLMHHKQLICKQHQLKSSIIKLKKENKHFRESMNKLEEKLRTAQVNIEIITAEPRTKLYNFKTLLQRYIKAMNEHGNGNQDLQSAEVALTEMETVLNTMDAASKKEIMQHDLLSLRPRFLHLGLDIMRAKRELREAGDFRMYNPRKDHLRRCKVYLLDDMVLIHRKSKLHEVIWCIGLKWAKVELEEEVSSHNDSDDSHTCMLIVYGREAVVELETASRATAENWKISIETSTEGQQGISYKAEDPNFPTGRRAPRFQRPKSVRACQRCHLVFNRQTKHNCEACGFVVCRHCSKYERTLPYSHRQKLHRVCKHCEDRLNIDSGK